MNPGEFRQVAADYGVRCIHKVHAFRVRTFAATGFVLITSVARYHVPIGFVSSIYSVYLYFQVFFIVRVISQKCVKIISFVCVKLYLYFSVFSFFTVPLVFMYIQIRNFFLGPNHSSI